MKSVQVKAIYICSKEKNVKKVMFYWNTEITYCKYQNKVEETK